MNKERIELLAASVNVILYDRLAKVELTIAANVQKETGDE